jgi:hypothetical protein
MDGRVLIGSVFANDSPEQARWLALQLAYIRSTTCDFHHVVFLPSSDRLRSRFFMENTKFLPNLGKQRITSHHAHALGLQELLRYFKDHRRDYSMFLFIDSDAFPIRKNWLDLLCERMTPPIEIAIAIRPENIEQRLHSSILLATRQALDNLSWEVGRAGVDLVGRNERDVIVPFYQHSHRERVFTLVRSNQYNIHPLLCGIYYDMFYHHGCGSGREFKVRSQRYWAHAVDEDIDVAALTEQLMNDPVVFVNRLAGWRAGDYATPNLVPGWLDRVG